MATLTRKHLTLSSGRTWDVMGGVVGLSLDGLLCTGAEDNLPTPGAEWSRTHLTPEECVEIAELMLTRWQAFRATWLARCGESTHG